MLNFKIKTICLKVLVLTLPCSVAFSQTVLLPVQQQQYQSEANQATCISHLYNDQKQAIAVAVDGHKIFIHPSQLGSFYLSNLKYGVSTEPLEFFTTYPQYYILHLEKAQHQKNKSELRLKLYRYDIGEEKKLIVSETVTLHETCKNSKLGSIFYQRSSVSKLLQFLFYRH